MVLVFLRTPKASSADTAPCCLKTAPCTEVRRGVHSQPRDFVLTWKVLGQTHPEVLKMIEVVPSR